MSDYGAHPTQYGNLSDGNLYAMYRESVYRSLSESQKLDLLQETVNRDAAARGEAGSPRVQFENMPSRTDGYAEKGVISVNRDLAVNGTRTATYQGKTLQHTINDYNIQSLVTVLHENVHCYQDQIIDGTIRNADPQLAAEYRANDFTISMVQQGNNLDFGSQYLTGETSNGYYFYYFQATERDAFRWSEEEASRIVQELTAKYGMEPSFEAYEKTLQANGYSVMEVEVIQRFQNPDFVKDLNQVLMNQYYDTHKSVDARTEQAVKNEMVQSRQALQPVTTRSLSTGKEQQNMSFQYTPMTVEEYDQFLRNAVNEYYVHAMNDPNMSGEEALRTSGEAAERYLTAVEEYKAAMENNAENKIGAVNDNLNTGGPVEQASAGAVNEQTEQTSVNTGVDAGTDVGVSNSEGCDEDVGLGGDLDL